MRVQIFQIKDDDAGQNYIFRGYDSTMKRAGKIDPSLYEKVYDYDEEDNADLEDIYFKFNEERPEDFKGRSLSVSDVIVVSQDGDKKSCYFCDSYGWQPVDFEFDDSVAVLPETNKVEEDLEFTDKDLELGKKACERLKKACECLTEDENKDDKAKSDYLFLIKQYERLAHAYENLRVEKQKLDARVAELEKQLGR